MMVGLVHSEVQRLVLLVLNHIKGELWAIATVNTWILVKACGSFN